MRILAITQTFAYFDPGGRTSHVRPLVRNLTARGHQVTVLTSGYGRGDGPRSVVQGGVEVRYLRPWARFRTLTVDPGVLSFCSGRLGEFEIVHVHGLYHLLGPYVAWRCRRRRIPYLVETMGMVHSGKPTEPSKRLFRSLFEGRLLGGAERLVATSPRERADLMDTGIASERISVRMNGVDLSPAGAQEANEMRSRWSVPEEAPLVLFLGRIARVKGLELLVEAFARLDPNARLALVGPWEDEPYREELATLGARLGVADRVVFTGPLYDGDKTAALKSADVFVLPSERENFGIAAGEAMACGTPTVVTDTCGIAPMVRRWGGLVVRRKPVALEEAIRRLLEDDAVRRRARSSASEVADALSWKRLAADMEEIYLDALRS